MKADGIYYPHNKNFSIPSDIHKKFEIIGAAHNIKEINLRKDKIALKFSIGLFEHPMEQTGFLVLPSLIFYKFFQKKVNSFRRYKSTELQKLKW